LAESVEKEKLQQCQASATVIASANKGTLEDVVVDDPN
jgi:hypothetical protein